MLITARTYSASQFPDRTLSSKGSRYHTLSGWRKCPDAKRAIEMLMIHQVGSVRVGEVVRYTITYTPAADPILPIPSELYVRVKNTSALPLRAAYLHGPYTLYAACYPAKFDPNIKYERQDLEGAPQYEPYLKAGGGWDAVIKVPSYVQNAQNFGASGNQGSSGDQSVTWIVEIQSQVIFSSSAAVHFELLVGRDEKSLEYFSGGSWSNGHGPPGKLLDHWSPDARGKQALAAKGVYSKSIALQVDDTNSLWNSPPFPTAEDSQNEDGTHDLRTPTEEHPDPQSRPEAPADAKKNRKKKVHLVLLTHGLHSNLGTDMLYMKESIDAATKTPRRRESHAKPADGSRVDTDEGDEEQVIVRGFSGNAVRTERGIQYLGKRLAKYVLLLTYPDQPYFPLKGSKPSPLIRPFTARKQHTHASHPHHVATENSGNTIGGEDHPYQITSISFIGHSLGGLIQTYAIAYIQKHSPEFFDKIQPVNFIALASPFLGLSNENPMYVRFALDLGLVGRTGQDLGLSWTAPKVRSGWGAIIAGRGDSAKDQAQPDPGAKPLLRILPCGPAHEVLSKFQHRTVYSNVVNDGIVPLRTSCLLFLDWKGLDRVEKARRDNGLVGTMAEWGWAELTGAHSKSPRLGRSGDESPLTELAETGQHSHPTIQVPQRQKGDEVDEAVAPRPGQFLAPPSNRSSHMSIPEEESVKEDISGNASPGPLDTFFSLFRPKENKTPHSGKNSRIYRRSQTLGSFEAGDGPAPVTHGHSTYENDGVHTPPKTTFFESAGDLLMPPLPPPEFILDPASRPRTIFHDRIYHPEDIPPPMPVKRRTLAFGSLQNKQSKSAPNPAATQLPPGSSSSANSAESGLKVEEKIARAYHRDLSWRKVLVRLEPDAHNNIIVRRMFTNAHGWPVVKHLVDTHFAHMPVIDIQDSQKRSVDRAMSPNVGPTSSGDEVEDQTKTPELETDKDTDDLPDVSGLNVSDPLRNHGHRSDAFSGENESQRTMSPTEQGNSVSRQDSARWTDREVDEDDCESGFEEEVNSGFRWSRQM
ncbi:hypothetical protein N7499_002460 [Penicillium canescens]|nr:hypothetical protein N7499_002460 [Penicillium canescens]KAJ6166074.1 hypothetical protein N7485_009318 [Penicillium canescens]